MRLFFFFFVAFFVYCEDIAFFHNGEFKKGEITLLSNGKISLKANLKNEIIASQDIRAVSWGITKKSSGTRGNFVGLAGGGQFLVDKISFNENYGSFIWYNQEVKFKRQQLNFFQQDITLNSKKYNINRHYQTGLFDRYWYFPKSFHKNFYLSRSLKFDKDFTETFSLDFFRNSNATCRVSIANFIFLNIKDNFTTIFVKGKLHKYIKNTKKDFEVSISYEAQTKKWRFFLEDKLISEVFLDEENFVSHGLHLSLYGYGDLALWGMKTNLWSKNNEDRVFDSLTFKNNDFIKGKILSLDKGKLEVVEPLGKYKLPIDNMVNISFADFKDEVKSPIGIFLKNNQRLYAEQVFFDKDFVIAKTKFLGELKLPQESLELIVFPKKL